MYSSMLSETLRFSRLVFTRFSMPEYVCTTNHSPGWLYKVARNSSSGSAGTSSASPAASTSAKPSPTTAPAPAAPPAAPPGSGCRLALLGRGRGTQARQEAGLAQLGPRVDRGQRRSDRRGGVGVDDLH